MVDVFKNGNAGKVERNTPFLVFHYPYYAGIPISAIRMGDYKFMRQLNTGETRLHNVKTDMGENENLIKSMPEKAAELDKLLQDYIAEVGAWDIEDVYRERLSQLIEHFSDEDFDELMTLLERSDSLGYAEILVRTHLERAQAELEAFPDSDAKSMMLVITDIVKERHA